ncbi:2OG-Fe(II) oxygenase [Entomobacter blattae]|uniref:2OG-Fe(II) oxygenase superfamily protein n=1 Tax=Entomobacter blattae TaxID=2762277 RepID=A0A7H1NPW1_9PROT|nr:2OG-Fe(II) oxygenase [Entomobacter blattae]QNT77821.1 2OG-Fe(II) oxygenase superfamily protein [Entomobacter blattae]
MINIETNRSIHIDDKQISTFIETGTAMFPMGVVFTKEELQYINDIQIKLPQEQVIIGDAGEPNLLYVSRLMVDLPGEKPTLVNRPLSESIINILNDKIRQKFFKKLLGKEKYLRRCQINRMTKNSFIGRHIDRDSNPDYDVAVVIHLGKQFDGGEFVVYPDNNKSYTFRPNYGTVLISQCKIPHEVLTVNSDERVSLVFFLSDYLEENRRIKNH